MGLSLALTKPSIAELKYSLSIASNMRRSQASRAVAMAPCPMHLIWHDDVGR